MPLIIHPESHLDHQLTARQLAHILHRYVDRSGLFVDTFELPDGLGEISNALYGPSVGDAPIPNSDVVMFRRGSREWESRCVRRPVRATRTMTVIGGPHDGFACVLFTAFGGPSAPLEVGDPTCKDPDASITFWREHALAIGPSS